MKKIGILSLATLMSLSLVGCGKDNKKPDTFTSSSITSESDYKTVKGDGDSLITAMSKYKGTYLHATNNEDGSIDVGYFIYTLKKSDDGKYYITQTFGANDDGSVNQTVKNLEREKKGTAYFISHSYGEIIAIPKNVYVAVSGESAPTFATRTYYTRTGTSDENYVYTLLTAAPADWSTNYTSYFKVDHVEYENVSKVDWKAQNTPVVGGKMYYKVGNLEYKKDTSGKVTSVVATLNVYRIDPIV